MTRYHESQEIDRHRRMARFTVCPAICLGLALLLLVGCSGSDDGGSGDPDGATDTTAGFRFLDLTAVSRLSDALRDRLEDQLGSDAIWKRSPLDLTIIDDGFLKSYFPDVQQLNERLNYAPGERIEHAITRLMYRYPQRKNLPFSYVELIFSNLTDKPLVFRIRAPQTGEAVVETLKERYGQPKVIEWRDGNGQALYWRQPGEIMIATIVPDRYGELEYGIHIMFTEHLEELLQVEEAERRERQRKKEKAGEKAF